MLNNDLQVYDACNLNVPPIPPRSRLYSLEPIGIGTPYVESLTSFLMRIAEAHSLDVNTLVTKEINNYFNQKYLQKHSKKGLSTLFNKATALNNGGFLSSQLYQALELLTSSNNLSCLTLSSINHLFSTRKLLRRSKAWCPSCYEHWANNNEMVYEPILWSFESITICPIHFQPLEHKCPCCDRSIPWLTGQSKVGFCPKCNFWLGSFASGGYSMSESELAKSIWISQNLGKLISYFSVNTPSIPSKNVQIAFNLIIDSVCEGNIAALARIFNFPKNTVWMWSKGKSVPEIRAILLVCYCFDISLLDFVLLEQKAFKQPRVITQRMSKNRREKRASPREFKYKETEKYLMRVLSSTEPPVNMKEVARRLKIDRRTIYSHFPNLCTAISGKYRKYKKQQTAMRIQKCCQEVEQAVSDIHLAGEYPNEARVSKRISQPGYFRYKKVRQTLSRAVLELYSHA